MMVVEAYYSMLTGLFSPVLGMNYVVAELVLAALVVFMTTIIYRFFADQNKAREMKSQLADMQNKMKEVKDNKEETDKIAGEMMKLTNQQFRNSMKPMVIVLLVVFLFFPWMASVFSELSVSLPFSIPLLGNNFSWLIWYIVISIPLSMIFRKALGVVS